MLVNNYKPINTYTLPEEVNSAKNIEMSHNKFQMKAITDGSVHAVASIFSKYHYILNPYIFTTTLSEEDYHKYYQKPKLLSYDLYGTPELWSGLLYINNMVSVTNFTKRTIKIFNTGIMTAITEIMTVYSDDMKNNDKEVYG